MILAFAAVATGLVLALLVISSTWGIPVLFAAKPIIDATWRSSFSGYSLLDLIGVAVPSIMVVRMALTHRHSFFNRHLSSIAFTLFAWNVVVAVGMFATNENPQVAADYFFRSLSFCLAVFLIPFYVKDPGSFRRLLLFFLVAGLFPVAVGLYQAATGTIWELRIGAYGQLQRNVGLYHDAFSFRAYGFQTLTAILLFWSYFAPRTLLVKVGLLAYAISCAVVMFNVYSKAAVVTAITWCVVWLVFHPRRVGVLVPIIVFGICFAMFDELILEKLGLLFAKEVEAYRGDIAGRYVLAGRPTIWLKYWSEWLEAGVLLQLFGLWKTASAHNDLLRVLYTSGVVGLVIYCLFLARAGMLVWSRVARDRSVLAIVGLMLFVMWIIDVTGLNPSLYPAYSWYVWGFIVLAIRGVPGLRTAKSLTGSRNAPILDASRAEPIR